MMQENSKPNLRSKLRLKRDNNDSTQRILDSNPKTSIENKTEKVEENCHEESTPPDKISPNSEDSLADFKSPKAETSKRPILSKFKIDAEKVKRKITKSKSKSSTSKKKTSSSKDQPSIESSFFKPQTSELQNEVQVSFPCPLCLKPFKDETTCTNHMKTCASKSNVSVMQLLDAKRLQDRQADERRAMGLPAAPIIPEKKKSHRPKNFSTKDDPQLQLAMALSESSYQAEQMEELEQAALLEGIPSECIRHMDEEDRVKTLQNFGFTTNKPVESVPVNRTRKKKLQGPTILQSRSKEDKDRVLTERIACILTGDDALTQVTVNPGAGDCPITVSTLKSKLLKEIKDPCNKLWDQSRLTKKHNDFYVKDLKYHFMHFEPSNEEGSGASKDNASEPSCSLNYSIEYEPMEIDLILDNSEQERLQNLPHTDQLGSMKTESDFMKSTINNWSEALNDSAASDVIIFTKFKHIYAHKLVFHIQCSNILLDIQTNDSNIQTRVKEKISWLDKDQIPSLAFLEFIYCGAIVKNAGVFGDEEYLSQINKLARHYRVEKLFSYIRMKKRESKSKEACSEICLDSPKNISKTDQLLTKSPTQNCKELNIETSGTSDQRTKKQVSTENMSPVQSSPIFGRSILSKAVANELLLSSSDSRRITASPDLFETEDEEDDLHTNETHVGNKSQRHEDDVNLKILENLIGEEDEDECIPKQLSCQENVDIEHVGISNSQNTIVNLSESPSPQNHEVPSNDEALHEASTPINARSPQRDSDHLEMDDLSQTELCDTVTPKTRSPTNHGDLDSVAEIEMQELKHEAVTPEACTPPKIGEYVTQRHANRVIEDSPPAIAIESASMHTAITPPKSAISEQEVDSIHIVVTPPASLSHGFDLSSEENIRSLTSSLNSFIDKVQRKNARGLLDSDSDESTGADECLKNNKKKKNPFSKKYQDDSYRYLRSDGPNKLADKRVISLLENDELEANSDSVKLVHDQMKPPCHTKRSARIRRGKNSSNDLENENLKPLEQDESDEAEVATSSLPASRSEDSRPSGKSRSSFETDDQSFEHKTLDLLEESQMSMYSKYKSTNKNDNSIANYRNRINFNSVVNSSRELSHAERSENSNHTKDSSREDTNTAVASSDMEKSSAVMDDICVISDSDEEQAIGVEVSRTKEKSSKAIGSKTPSVSQDCKPTHSQSGATESSRKSSQSRKLSLSNRKKSSGSLGSSDDQVWLSTRSESTKIDYGHKQVAKIIDISIDSDEDNRHAPKRLEIEAHTALTKRKRDDEFERSKRRKTDTPPRPKDRLDELDDEINKILELNSSPGSVEKLTPNKSTSADTERDDPIIQCDGINLSPISIPSSPEAFRGSNGTSEKTDLIREPDAPNKQLSDLDPIEDDCLNTFDFNDDWMPIPQPQVEEKGQNNRSKTTPTRRKLSFEEPIPDTLPASESLMNATETEPSNIPKSSIVSLISSPILSQNRRNARISHRKMAGSETAGAKTENIKSRKLMVKSVSASNLPAEKTETNGCSLQRSSSFVTPEQNKKVRRNQDVTPPIDYSLLETPELQKQLSRFGVKPQNRNNAKQLLRHIYEATHPVVNNNPQKRETSPESCSEDEQPPVKKPNVKQKGIPKQKKSKNLCNESDPDENRPEVAEEMEYDEADTANVLENPSNIKDVFCRLIQSNKELYTKVLTYEPLPLEPLHALLKLNGLKCKMNSLMDFLDEQCITFQVQNGKGSRTKRKAK